MRYIGGKTLMLDRIGAVLRENTADVRTVADVFAGSGVVSRFFKQAGLQVFSNDFLYFSYVLSRGTLCLNAEPDFSKLGVGDPIAYLNRLTPEESGIDAKDCFIYQNYSPNDHCRRMYFQNQNALKIDVVRQTIERWREQDRISEDGYFYLLAALIAAVPYVSNIAGVYGAYLKYWDARSFHPLTLERPELIPSAVQAQAYQEDALALAGHLHADVAYLDPPYNARQYLPNYHVLETVARYDRPPLRGVTGMRPYADQRSAYCIRSQAEQAFRQLFEALSVRYLLVSYNNEGLLSTEAMTRTLCACGKADTFRLYEYDYRRYKNKIPNNQAGLKEQIYFIEKR